MIKFVLAYFIVGVLCMMFVTPVYYAKGVAKMIYGDEAGSYKVRCMIPVYNVIWAESTYTGSISFVGLSFLITVISLVVRLVAVFVFTYNSGLQIFTVVLFLASLILVYIANFYCVFILLHDTGALTMARQIIYSLFPPVGQWYVGSVLPTIVSKMEREEETF